ncbi:Argonaute siRNA chaperone complex subunit Arb1-domain-containing protein [Coniochaeta sp. 2T2.1]|nr:Argonaute siRNA chaperone complex subunit Arb1-domain-containing protein [Coniochaeta sp. 2T2.1]
MSSTSDTLVQVATQNKAVPDGAVVGVAVAQPPTKGDETSKRQGATAVAQSFPRGQAEFKFDSWGKRKRKKKGFQARGPTALVKNRGTGFEEGFCDPPMTPAEAEEEKNDIYSPNRPFEDRMQDALQRYRARRRMDSNRKNLFDKYLELGGIDTSPRMFQGKKYMNMTDATNDEIRGMTATDIIGGSSNGRFYDPREPEDWDVDFAGVVAGYFSERIFKLAGTDLSVIKMAADVVENLLNYILHHDVCPEYNDNIKQAKAICQESVDQITRCFRVIWEAPGDFNIACSSLFDHGKRKIFDPDSAGNPYYMPADHAQRVFYASMAVQKFLFNKLKGKPIKDIEVIDEFKQTFEVVEIIVPAEGQAKAYLGVKNAKGETGRIKACGRVVLSPYLMEDGYDKGTAPIAAPGISEREEFILDWSILEHMTVGMKLKLVICQLNIDLKFIKAFFDVRPRYYTFLPQELMYKYKEPVPNERPPPSVENPDIDEGGDDPNLD